MTVTVANTSNTNTFDYWRNRTNELAYAMSTYVVTAGGSNAAVGDASITGIFTANTLVSNTISIGNNSVNVVISTANSTQISNGQYFLNANGNWSLISAPVYISSLDTSGTGNQAVDSYELLTYKTVEYVFSVTDNNANNFLATKLLTMHNFGSVFYTEYATIISNSAMGSFSATTNSTHVIVNFNPTSSNTTVKFIRYNV